MRFSVIVPVYNVEDYLETCVASVIAQTCRDYELILVDDGSTDQSGAMCDRLARQYHCRVIHQANGGLGAARNTGIDAARGDYLVFLDSDDFLSPDTLQGLSEEYGSNARRYLHLWLCHLRRRQGSCPLRGRSSLSSAADPPRASGTAAGTAQRLDPGCPPQPVSVFRHSIPFPGVV